MKRRFFTLAMALVLCLNLAVPALAADASSLDAATALAYAGVLAERIETYGVRSGGDKGGVQYAGLVDMNADGAPELIVIAVEDNQGHAADVGIWSMKSGKAVRTVEFSILFGVFSGRIAFARKNGRIRLFSDCDWQYRAYEGRNIDLIDCDGTIENDFYNNGGEGTHTSREQVTYDTSWVVDSTPIMQMVDYKWAYSASQAQAVQPLQSALLARANQTQTTAPTGGYGPYTVAGVFGGYSYVVTFDAAIVKKTTVTLEYGHDDATEPPITRETERVTMITLRPGSNIAITGGDRYEGNTYISVGHYSNLGGNYAVDSHSTSELYAGPTEKTFSDTADDIICLLGVSDGDGDSYFVALGSSAPAAGASTSTGFTDVPANEYYAAPVSWAVGKGITTGTSATTFSPNNTCNNAEILTFIWRAKGQPEPGISNPFSNVKTGDYYYKAALWAYQNGMVSGSTFSATVPCTRGMAVTYLWKASGSPAAGGSSFSDVPAGASYAQAVAWAVSRGVTNGDGGNAFSPNKTCTRGQIVTFLYRTFA